MQLTTHSESAIAGRENQDFISAKCHPQDAGIWICVLADGAGGQAGGALAAKIAVESCEKAILNLNLRDLWEKSAWRAILESADVAVEAENEAGITTLIACAICETQICGASVGDSAVIAFSDSQINELSERQRKNPPVGSGGAWPTPFGFSLRKGWQIVLMSDGVWRYLGMESVAQIGRENEPQMAIEKIRAHHARPTGLPDDFSVIWAKI